PLRPRSGGRPPALLRGRRRDGARRVGQRRGGGASALSARPEPRADHRAGERALRGGRRELLRGGGAAAGGAQRAVRRAGGGAAALLGPAARDSLPPRLAGG